MQLTFKSPLRTAGRKGGVGFLKPLRTAPSNVSRLGTGGSTPLNRGGSVIFSFHEIGLPDAQQPIEAAVGEGDVPFEPGPGAVGLPPVAAAAPRSAHLRDRALERRGVQVRRPAVVAVEFERGRERRAKPPQRVARMDIARPAFAGGCSVKASGRWVSSGRGVPTRSACTSAATRARVSAKPWGSRRPVSKSPCCRTSGRAGSSRSCRPTMAAPVWSDSRWVCSARNRISGSAVGSGSRKRRSCAVSSSSRSVRASSAATNCAARTSSVSRSRNRRSRNSSGSSVSTGCSNAIAATNSAAGTTGCSGRAARARARRRRTGGQSRRAATP